MRALLVVLAASAAPAANTQDTHAIDAPPLGVFTHRAMWTEFEFQIYARPGSRSTDEVRRIADEAFAEIDRLEQCLNTWDPGSETSALNRRAANGPVKVSPALFNLIEASLSGYRNTDGAFDVTIGPLLDLYGFYGQEFTTPRIVEIEETLKRIGSDKICIDNTERTVQFLVSGVRLDFGGIAKGYALDAAARLLREYGVTSALLSGGTSSMLAIGSPRGRDAWLVSVPDPRDRAKNLAEVELVDEAISTSSCYRRKAGRSEDAPCDIIDPRTGQPVSGVATVTVIGKEATVMETLSKAFLIFGRDGTDRYVSTHPGLRVVLLENAQSGNSDAVRFGFQTERSEP